MDGRRLPAGAVPAVVACGLAAAAWLVFAPTFVYYDAWYSLIWGRELAHARMPELDTFAASTPHPLAILWAGLATPLGGGAAIEILRGIAWLSYGAATVAVFRVARLAFDSTAAGGVAAVTAATSYALLRPASLAAIDVSFAALALSALALELERPRRGLPVLALLGLAGLLRPEAWLLAAAYWLWLAPRAEMRERLTAAALVGAPPAIWGLVDLASTGNLLHSLQHTQEGAELAFRPTGLVNVPVSASTGLRELVRAPVVLGGFAGVALALRHRRAAAAMPAVTLGLALAFFAVLGIARLPLLDRFLILPAALLTVFFGHALTGWRDRRAWTVGAALLGLLALLFVPSQLDRLRQLREGDDIRARAERDMRELVRSEPVRAALGACDGIAAPVRAAHPQLAYHAGLRPPEVEVLQDPTPRSDLLLLPATVPVAENYTIDRVVLDELRRRVLPRYRTLASNRSWVLGVRRCRPRSLSQAATSRPLSTTSEARASSSRSSTASSTVWRTSGSVMSPTSGSTGAIVHPERKRSNTRGSM